MALPDFLKEPTTRRCSTRRRPAPCALRGHPVLLRLPIGAGRGVSNVIARSTDGITFTVIAEVTKEQFGAESLERPRTTAGATRAADGAHNLSTEISD